MTKYDIEIDEIVPQSWDDVAVMDAQIVEESPEPHDQPIDTPDDDADVP